MEDICGFPYPDKYGRTQEELRERAIELGFISKDLSAMGVQIYNGCIAGVVEDENHLNFLEGRCIRECEL